MTKDLDWKTTDAETERREADEGRDMRLIIERDCKLAQAYADDGAYHSAARVLTQLAADVTRHAKSVDKMLAAMTKQTILPRLGDGSDWGTKRRLVATSKDGRVQLFIRGGHYYTAGARGFGRTYAPASLILAEARYYPSGGRRSRHLAEGRITNKTLLEHAAKINEAFGVPIAAKLDVRTTVEIG